MTTDDDPSLLLPRDETGRYLHLKLKRFASIDDLTMPFAIKTWNETPHDAEVGISSSARSKCRDCHEVIKKGELRFRLWLQCHKGCKSSAYFHESCFYKYPESKKLESVEEIMGFVDLDRSVQNCIEASFDKMKKAGSVQSEELNDVEVLAKPAKKKRKTQK